MTSYSQFGQDLHVLNNIFNGKQNGYFVDIGAFDGVTDSNSYLMEKNFNWKGIIVECNPIWVDNIKHHRRNLFFPCAVYNEDDRVMSFYNTGNGLSGLVETNNHTNIVNSAVVNVTTKKLTTILKEANAPKYIDFLSLDTEGSEYEILKHHDFDKHLFGYICVEHNYIETNRCNIRELLESKGYVFYRSNNMDDDYLHSSLFTRPGLGVNPYLINIPDQDNYNREDYIYIQEQLTSKKQNVAQILNTLYAPINNFYLLNDFHFRCLRGLTQTFVDNSSNKLPLQQLFTIGDGGDNKSCFVCCTPFSHDHEQGNSRYIASQLIVKSLEEVGFNGYFYLFNGGFPNPTGTEMKYAGVPYCFKIFMMLEAKNKGFNKVIWLDSGCYAINNPSKLFDILEHQDTLIETKGIANYQSICFEKTRELLNEITKTELLNANYVQTIVFGLNLDSASIKNVIKEYYEMVKLGWPFLSIFPEEIVFTALFNKPEYKHLLYNQPESAKLQIHENRMNVRDAVQNNYYFQHRNYKPQPDKLYVSFDNIGGRFGNQLFRYVTCKLFTVKSGHKYIVREDFPMENYIIVNDSNIVDILNNPTMYATKHILCQGYFQKSELFVDCRPQIMNLIYSSDNYDYWLYKDEYKSTNDKMYIKECLINNTHGIDLNPSDIVVSLRLDDFIQYPCKTSDIIPTQHYADILTRMNTHNKRVYIVCDTIKHDWEHKYVEYFKQWNPILIQGSLIHDIALIRDCNILLHSNSTLCWMISFLSNKMARFIPNTHFNTNQSLLQISHTDQLFNVCPLSHAEVNSLNINNTRVLPLSFCVPDECVVSEIPHKETLMASIIPGDNSTYIFSKHQEKEYNEMYQKSRFAITKMKGGWDCLRHYEILMNGCIPLFENIKDCPSFTLTTYPKELNDEAYHLYESWIENDEYISKYDTLCAKYIEHTRTHCTTSAVSKYFLKNMRNGEKAKNILLITGHHGINYNRESLWIGLKRYIASINGVAVEYDPLPFLYNDFDDTNGNKYYGHSCFTLPKRLDKDDNYNMSELEIKEKIKNKFWDIIVYGKVGPDEFCDFPLYDLVKQKYSANQIAFIFGGDEIFDLTVTDTSKYHVNMFNRNIYYYPYSDYLNNYKHMGTCFVRELNK
jgi:FkbM family methyltransferase